MMQGSAGLPAPQLSPALSSGPGEFKSAPQKGQKTESSIAPVPPRPAGRHFWQGGRRKAGRRGAGSAGCRPDLAAEGSTPGPRQHGWPAPFLRVLLRNETSAPARDDSVPSQSVSAARAPAAVSWRALPSPPRALPSYSPPPRPPAPGAGSAQTRLFVSAGILGEAGAAAMPGKLKVKIVAGRHLPVMDRASDLTDAFVEVGAWSCPPRARDAEPCPARRPRLRGGMPTRPQPVGCGPGHDPGVRAPPGHLPVRGVAAETFASSFARTTSFMSRRLRAMAAACPRSQPSGHSRSPTVRRHPALSPTLSESALRVTQQWHFYLLLCRLVGR